MEQFMIDTNAVSHYLSCILPVGGMAFMDAVVNENPNLSIISKIELLCWKTNKIEIVSSFVEDSHIFNITDDVIKHCILIRKGKKIKTPDAIIAASALAFGFTLVTDNERDFLQIHGLKIINPNNL